MDVVEREKILKILQDVQKTYFSESDRQWYKYLDQTIEELEYAKE